MNQRRVPDGERFGGRPWQSLGVFTITGDTLRVRLSANGTNGSVAADAVRIVARTQPLPDLQVLNLRDNPLDNDAYQFFAPLLRAHQKLTFDFDRNRQAPQLTRFAPQGSRGEGISLVLSDKATDLDNDPLTFTVHSSEPNVLTDIQSNQTQTLLLLTPINGFTGTTRITVTVHDDDLGVGDPRGRTAVQTFDFHVNAGAIYGNKWDDSNRNGENDQSESGLEGWTIFLDNNRNGVLNASEPRTLTDANGDYSFTDLAPFQSYTVAEQPQNGWEQTAPLDLQDVFLAAEIRPGPDHGLPSEFTEFKGALYFRVDGGDDRGNELWRFDGTRARRAADINPGAGSSFPFGLAVFNGHLYFSADGDGDFVWELWRFDGTTAERVEIAPGQSLFSPFEFTEFKNELYFSADGGDGAG